MGRAMLSKSFIQFSVDGRDCVPSQLFTWGQTLVEAWVAAGLLRVGGAECGGACMGPFEGGHHYLHYLHHSLASGQITGREHSPAHQQKIGLKIY